MTTRKRYGYLLILVLLWQGSASGNDAKNNHAVWGVGQRSCNGFNTARNSHTDNDFKQHLMGYLTAYNTLSEDTYSVSGTTDIDGILTLIDKFCQKTPTDSYDHALEILVTDLHKTRTQKAPSTAGWGR